MATRTEKWRITTPNGKAFLIASNDEIPKIREYAANLGVRGEIQQLNEEQWADYKENGLYELDAKNERHDGDAIVARKAVAMLFEGVTYDIVVLKLASGRTHMEFSSDSPPQGLSQTLYTYTGKLLKDQ